MQWNDLEGSGFSTAEPWMRINPNYVLINEKQQESDGGSVLSFYKKMISLRKNPAYRNTFVYGSFTPVCENENDLMAYRRTGEADILVLANISGQIVKVSIDPSFCRVLLNNTDAFILEGEGTVCLEPFQAVVLEKITL